MPLCLEHLHVYTMWDIIKIGVCSHTMTVIDSDVLSFMKSINYLSKFHSFVKFKIEIHKKKKKKRSSKLQLDTTRTTLVSTAKERSTGCSVCMCFFIFSLHGRSLSSNFMMS